MWNHVQQTPCRIMRAPPQHWRALSANECVRESQQYVNTCTHLHIYVLIHMNTHVYVNLEGIAPALAGPVKRWVCTRQSRVCVYIYTLIYVCADTYEYTCLHKSGGHRRCTGCPCHHMSMYEGVQGMCIHIHTHTYICANTYEYACLQ